MLHSKRLHKGTKPTDVRAERKSAKEESTGRWTSFGVFVAEQKANRVTKSEAEVLWKTMAVSQRRRYWRMASKLNEGRKLASLPELRPLSKTTVDTQKPVRDPGPASPTTINCAAHLNLLGHMMSQLADQFNAHSGPVSVEGSLSVALDALVCSLAPLAVVLANQVAELNGSIDDDTQRRILTNISYLMPGISGLSGASVS